jgi:hypothetical protein
MIPLADLAPKSKQHQDSREEGASEARHHSQEDSISSDYPTCFQAV